MAALLEVHRQIIEFVVGGYELLGQLQVGLQQRLGGPGDGLGDKRGHPDDPRLDLVQFLVEGLAQFPHPGLRTGAQPNRPVT